MAIAEMRKLNLAAMSYDRDNILDALQKTGAAEVKTHALSESLSPVKADSGSLCAYLNSLESALAILSKTVENTDKERKIKSDIIKDGFSVTYTQFMDSRKNKEEMDALVSRINFLADERIRIDSEIARLDRQISAAQPYSAVTENLSAFVSSLHVSVKLGTVPSAAVADLKAQLNGIPLADFNVLAETEEQAVIVFIAHKSITDSVENALSTAAFTPCPFIGDYTGDGYYGSLTEKKAALKEERQKAEEELYSLREQLRPLKTYCDYTGYELEKAELAEKLPATERTFLLEAYVPKGAEERLSAALNGAASAVYYEFSDVAEDEVPPTLMKNNGVVSNFEAITNMYSVPSSREFDPNTIMAFFYSLFLGFIMADIGYGLLMVLGGGFLWYKNRRRESGIKRLSGVFAIGGIFTILWGVLFNSFFGFSIFPFDIMPTAIDLKGEEMMSMWSLLGIQIPAVLLIALIIGTVQLGVGYFCKALQCWRRGKVWDGIFDGITWTVFSIGAALAIIGLIDEANAKILAYVGGIMAAAGLVIAMFTAGRHEKLLGKFTKGFGSAYGIINFLSDILSYARLYGLMLSGAVIAQIVSQYATQFITETGGVFIVVGVLLMVIGHVFNLAISLLGAYIHDARLQYVEFYGKFYEGEGELFTPIGSQHKYIYVEKA